MFTLGCRDSVPCPSQQYAAGRSLLRADADVAVVNDGSLLPPGGTFSFSLPFPPPGLNRFSSGYCWDVAQVGTGPV